MRPFHTYRDGLPPSPGIFATDRSADQHGRRLNIGDAIANTVADNYERGIVVGIYGTTVVYLVASSTEASDEGEFCCRVAGDALIIGHVENVLAEVARIEQASSARR